MGCSLLRYSFSKSFVFSLFLLKHFCHSTIPGQKFSLFYYSSQKSTIIPLFQEQNFRHSYSIIPVQPPASSPGVAPFLSAVPIELWDRSARCPWSCGIVLEKQGDFAIRSLPIKPRAPSSFFASATAPGDEAVQPPNLFLPFRSN